MLPTWEANVIFNSAKAWWRGEAAEAIYVADATETSASLFAEVGHERSGVFFS